MNEKLDLKNSYLQQIFEHIQDGIIVMNHDREILLMNPSAKGLTGWEIGDKVPYCSYCQSRSLCPEENQCYLIAKQEVPYFLSEMPVYHGKKIDVEMSTAMIYGEKESGKEEYLLVLRDQTIKRKAEEARISKLIIKKLIEAQENEHKRLAQELHDGVGQSLYSISVALQAIEAFVQDKQLHEYIDEVRVELDKVMNDVKSYSYHLRPQSLDRLGLVPTVESLVSTMNKNRKNIAITFESNLEDRLPPLTELNLYRVIQEALHNIMKYAKATKAEVTIQKLFQALRLTISDNGIGFDPSKTADGLGIKHMSERIDQLSGEFQIHSEAGKGTQILVTIPNEGDIA